MYSSSVFVYTPRQIVVLLDGNSPRKYAPVYSKPLTLHRGVDNKIQFQFLNQEQKKIDITGKEITCRLLSHDGSEILLQKALTLELPLTGIASLILNAADIEHIPPQKAYYTLEIPENQFDFPVFVDQNAGARGTMNIVNSVLPSFVPSQSVTIPTDQIFPNTGNVAGNTVLTYSSSAINTQNNSVITIQATFLDYYGNVSIVGSTLIDGDWYPIIEDVGLTAVTDTKGYTIKGYHPFIKMNFSSSSGEVTNILAR